MFEYFAVLRVAASSAADPAYYYYYYLYERKTRFRVPQDDCDKRNQHHALQQESEKRDDDEDVEGFALLSTDSRHCCSFAVVDAPTVEKLLQPSSVASTRDHRHLSALQKSKGRFFHRQLN